MFFFVILMLYLFLGSVQHGPWNILQHDAWNNLPKYSGIVDLRLGSIERYHGEILTADQMRDLSNGDIRKKQLINNPKNTSLTGCFIQKVG